MEKLNLIAIGGAQGGGGENLRGWNFLEFSSCGRLVTPFIGCLFEPMCVLGRGEFEGM